LSGSGGVTVVFMPIFTLTVSSVSSRTDAGTSPSTLERGRLRHRAAAKLRAAALHHAQRVSDRKAHGSLKQQLLNDVDQGVACDVDPAEPSEVDLEDASTFDILAGDEGDPLQVERDQGEEIDVIAGVDA
jgi:hypothetical protein